MTLLIMGLIGYSLNPTTPYDMAYKSLGLGLILLAIVGLLWGYDEGDWEIGKPNKPKLSK